MYPACVTVAAGSLTVIQYRTSENSGATRVTNDAYAAFVCADSHPPSPAGEAFGAIGVETQLGSVMWTRVMTGSMPYARTSAIISLYLSTAVLSNVPGAGSIRLHSSDNR